MATDKVEVQMRTDKVCKSCMRYKAQGQGALEVCRTIYVQNQAFEKLGKPDVITVTIEAVSLQADGGS